MSERICSVDGCEKSAWARGWCNMHYQRWRKHGATGDPAPQFSPAGTRRCDADSCEDPHYARGWCVKHYSRWRAHGDPYAYFPDAADAAERFWALVDQPAGAGGCWPWQGWIDHDGYGRFTAKNASGKWASEKAYRWIYVEIVGPVPHGSHLDHLCHLRTECAGGPACPHRACVNPGHLQATTPTSNVRRGSGAKLSLEKAATIRARYASGETGVSLACEFGVSKSNISFIVNGATWKP